MRIFTPHITILILIFCSCSKSENNLEKDHIAEEGGYYLVPKWSGSDRFLLVPVKTSDSRRIVPWVFWQGEEGWRNRRLGTDEFRLRDRLVLKWNGDVVWIYSGDSGTSVFEFDGENTWNEITGKFLDGTLKAPTGFPVREKESLLPNQ